MFLNPPTSPPTMRVSVYAPGRLHMGFIDLGGTLGRCFGSIGVGVNEIATRLEMAYADQLSVAGPGAQRATKAVAYFDEAFGVRSQVSIQIHESIPEHVGLGSGTQLALAVATGLAHLHGLELGIREIASAIERGARSGIGIAVFEQGGLIVDGGRGEQTLTPPVLVRLEVPAAWRFILVFDQRGQGLHGHQEKQAFNTLPSFPVEETARLCHHLLIKALPALTEGNLPEFGAVITDLQNSVGDHFAPAQGGRFTSAAVGAAMAWLAAQDATAIGQSSWGPTGFCLVENELRAAELVEAARRAFDGLVFTVASARSRGAEVVVEDQAIS